MRWIGQISQEADCSPSARARAPAIVILADDLSGAADCGVACKNWAFKRWSPCDQVLRFLAQKQTHWRSTRIPAR